VRLAEHSLTTKKKITTKRQYFKRESANAVQRTSTALDGELLGLLLATLGSLVADRHVKGEEVLFVELDDNVLALTVQDRPRSIS